MFIPVILGTARKERQSEKVSEFLLELIKKQGIETELIDVKDYRINATDNSGNIPEAKKWREKLMKANALILVSPEYNHSFPGELKIFLDMLYPEYYQKPVGFCTVSMGPYGGIRAAEQLKHLATHYGMNPAMKSVQFANIREETKETIKKYESFAKELIQELKELAEKIK
ncbi:MAG: NAD(P)H-dependent oxidoreductase [Candidatus Diapherotrites archaeon]